MTVPVPPRPAAAPELPPAPPVALAPAPPPLGPVPAPAWFVPGGASLPLHAVPTAATASACASERRDERVSDVRHATRAVLDLATRERVPLDGSRVKASKTASASAGASDRARDYHPEEYQSRCYRAVRYAGRAPVTR
jgi:hypothetical protein